MSTEGRRDEAYLSVVRVCCEVRCSILRGRDGLRSGGLRVERNCSTEIYAVATMRVLCNYLSSLIRFLRSFCTLLSELSRLIKLARQLLSRPQLVSQPRHLDCP